MLAWFVTKFHPGSPAVLFLFVVVSLLVVGCGQKSDTSQHPETTPAAPEVEKYKPPPEGTRSLITDVRASRDDKGGLVVEAKALLPKNTKVHVEVFAGNSKKAIERMDVARADIGAQLLTEAVGSQGVLRAGPFNAPKAGQYRVEVSSYFNGAWQSAEVLAQVGEKGSKLPATALVPHDPEFPKAGGYLETSTLVSVGGLPPGGWQPSKRLRGLSSL